MYFYAEGGTACNIYSIAPRVGLEINFESHTQVHWTSVSL